MSLSNKYSSASYDAADASPRTEVASPTDSLLPFYDHSPISLSSRKSSAVPKANACSSDEIIELLRKTNKLSISAEKKDSPSRIPRPINRTPRHDDRLHSHSQQEHGADYSPFSQSMGSSALRLQEQALLDHLSASQDWTHPAVGSSPWSVCGHRDPRAGATSQTVSQVS